MRKIFFDIETKNQFSDVGTTDARALDISVVCIVDENNEGRCFEEKEFGTLWPIIENTDLLIGFNSEHFDTPLLNKYYKGDLEKIRSIDLLKEVKKVLGFRVKLDTLAEATLGKKKIGHGLEAVIWWRNGEYEKVKEYCLEDVRITKEIYDFALKNGFVYFMDKGKKTKCILDTSSWEKEKELKNKITHTLPF